MVPNATFLLQKDVFSEDGLSFTEGLIRESLAPCAVEVVSDREVMEGSTRLRRHRGPFRGSLTMAQRMGRRLDFTDARRWAPALRRHLLSGDYYFLDAASVLDRFPAGARLFVRPASGFKEFSGNVFSREGFAAEFDFATRGKNVDPCTLCMVATPSPAPPDREYRMIFLDGALVGSSKYMEAGELSIAPGAPDDVTRAALEVGRNPYFLNVHDFVLDFAETPSGPRLLEVNAFETSSFYAADLFGIYSAWGKAVRARAREIVPDRLVGEEALEKAILLAAGAHRGQTDKAGQPYILHALRVMMMLNATEERVAGVLHDVVEDTAVTLDDLRSEGFPENIVRAVDALTKRQGETRLEAAARASKDPLARAVKLADNADNSDLSRIPEPTDKDFRRREEYRQVKAILKKAADGRENVAESDPANQERPTLPKSTQRRDCNPQ